MRCQRSVPRDQPKCHPKGLPARATRAQPARGRAPHALGQKRLAGVERIAELRSPREVLWRNRIELEQSRHECSRGLAVDPPTLGESNRMGQVGHRQRGGQERTGVDLGGVRGVDQLGCGAPVKAPTSTEVGIPGPQLAGILLTQAGSSSTSVITGATPETSSRRRTASEGR